MKSKIHFRNSSLSMMMNKSKMMITILLMMSFSSILLGCTSSSAAISENRMVNNNFYGLILKTNAQVILSQGTETSVRIEGDKNSVASVQTIIENGALIINGKNEIPVTIYVTVDEISLIEIDGIGKIFSNELISSDILLLKVSGSGTINVDVRCLSLGMIVKGNGRIYAKGSTVDSYIRVIGSGQVLARNLDSIKTTVEANAENHLYKQTFENTNKRGVLKLHQ